MPVTCEVDITRRLLHARLHSAGHLLDVAVTRSGIPGLTATKGYHFADGPYVEYAGELATPETHIPTLNNILKELIDADIHVDIYDISHEEAEKQGYHAPAGKSVRIVGYHGHEPCGCGGTHVRSTREIGAITVRKIGSKKGVVRISYEII